jgi:hypothetical protein
MEREYPQQPATCPYPEPLEAAPHHPKATTVSFLILSKSPLINNPRVLCYLNHAVPCFDILGQSFYV